MEEKKEEKKQPEAKLAKQTSTVKDIKKPVAKETGKKLDGGL